WQESPEVRRSDRYRPQAQALRSAANMPALVRSMPESIRRHVLLQRGQWADRAILPAKEDVGLAWGYREDSPRSRRIFHQNFPAGYLAKIESGRSSQAGPHFRALIPALLPQ